MERIVSKVRITKFSMMPRAIVNITDFLAISGGIDNDNDGRIDEDTSADMNNDGVLDIVTRNNIYHQNGSSFFNYDFSILF